MKNINVLPTEKGTGSLAKSPNTKYYVVSDHNRGISDHIDYNIYITSDEEIKEGDWVITYNGLLAKVITEFEWHFKNSKKIILTTDQDLINDGVQAIDDEFLEWFVKNPSCEFVEVVSAKTIPALQLTGNGHCWWKIIIPKEETKQETTSEGFHRISKEIDYSEFDFVSFKIGIEWQQEQDKNKYSEVFEWLANKDYLSDEVDIIQKEFEQFKKK